MTANPLSTGAPSPAEQQQADQLDRLITQCQQRAEATNTPATTTDETVLVAALVQMAADTRPNPAFVAALEARLQSAQATAPARRRFFFPLRRVAIAAALLLALGGALLLTPPARATLWDWLYGFGLIDEAKVMEQMIPLATPVTPPGAPTPLTLAAIEAQAPFAFRPPAWLPVGLRFTGGFVMPEATGTVVTLAYHLTDAPVGGYPADAPLLFVVLSDGPIPNRPLVAESYQQFVRIGNQSGIYTHGNWRSRSPLTLSESQAALVWDNTLDAAWLTWQADGLNYLLYAQGLQMTADQLVLAAVSMQ